MNDRRLELNDELPAHGILTIESMGYDGLKRRQRMLAYVVFGMESRAAAIERLGECRSLVADEAMQSIDHLGQPDATNEVISYESVAGSFRIDDDLNHLVVPEELRQSIAPGTVIAVGNYATDATITAYKLQ